MSEDLTLETAEKAHIVRVLDLCNGNRTHAAKILQIGSRTLQRKLKAWDLTEYGKVKK